MKETVYFGTYTKNLSKGIYRAFLDAKTQKLSTPQLIITVGNPTYLQVTPDNSLLTIATEGNLGGIANYYLPDDSFALLSDPLDRDTSPCYLSLDVARNLVFTAYYHRGSVAVYRLNPNQTLSLVDTVIHHGQGPRVEQDESHIHYADLTPDGRLAVIDLGTDTLTTYDITSNGHLIEKAVLHFNAGFGPRHLVFAPNGHYAYLVAELSSQIATLKYDSITGSFKIIQILPTIPDDWVQYNGAAAIRITRDGRFVYVSNRGYNSITGFAVQNDHSLKLIQQISTAGDFPRDFNFNHDDQLLIAANQNTNNVSLYTRDSNSGFLTQIQQNIPLPEGTCVCFKN